MFSEMKKRPVLTEAEIEENRRKWLAELEDSRHGLRLVRDMNDVIRILEDNAGTIHDVMQDKDANGRYDPYLQAAFDETMDILDYLKKLRNPS